jgi:formylglycine-generating enzyme required for sulfatase activity
MMRLSTAIACALTLSCLGMAPAHADKRVALVIGNADYQKADKLANPLTDARGIRDALGKLGFEIVYGENLGKQALERTIGRFADAAQDSDVALVFFAGHGATFGDVPYVVPVDAQFASLGGVPYELVLVETLIGELRRAKGLRIAILDACRDNAAERELKRTTTRGGEVTRGLARVRNPEGLILAYATQYLSTAADGDPKGDSPFTAALLSHIATPGLDVKELFFNVGREVIQATQGRQRPEISVSFYDRYALVPAEPTAPATKPVAPAAPMVSPLVSEAEHLWFGGVKDTTSRAVLEDFIRRYGDTIFGMMARERLEELKKAPVAAVVPPAHPATPPSPVTPAVGVFATAAPLFAERERALKPKDVLKECDKCPEMVVVPAGTFMMGSPASESGRMDHEGPRHSVRIGEPFAVGRFAVTFDEWDACVADGGCNGYRPSDAGWGRGRRPVIDVSWDNAKAYVAWLSRKTGKSYRLLSEAEREYVTRAGTTTPFWWGASISASQANYNGSVKAYARGPKGENREKTVPVDTFQPNAWGLFQVHGNVLEWVEDCYHDSYAGAPSDGSAWVSDGCTFRAVRNGSWGNDPQDVRSASRYWHAPDDGGVALGFRVARTLTP